MSYCLAGNLQSLPSAERPVGPTPAKSYPKSSRYESHRVCRQSLRHQSIRSAAKRRKRIGKWQSLYCLVYPAQWPGTMTFSSLWASVNRCLRKWLWQVALTQRVAYLALDQKDVTNAVPVLAAASCSSNMLEQDIRNNWLKSILIFRPSQVDKSSTSFGWGLWRLRRQSETVWSPLWCTSSGCGETNRELFII